MLPRREQPKLCAKMTMANDSIHCQAVFCDLEVGEGRRGRRSSVGHRRNRLQLTGRIASCWDLEIVDQSIPVCIDQVRLCGDRPAVGCQALLADAMGGGHSTCP